MCRMSLIGFQPYSLWQHCTFHSSSIYLWMFVCRCVCVSRKRKRVKCSEWTDLSTLYGRMMENTGLQGRVPQALFSFSNLQTVWVSYWYIVPPHSRMNVARILTALIWSWALGPKKRTHRSLVLYMYISWTLGFRSYTDGYKIILTFDRVLRNNHLNGLLDIGTIYSDQLQLIDLENNLILNLTQSGGSNYTLM